MISSPYVQVVDEPLPGGGCYPETNTQISSPYVQVVDGPPGGVSNQYSWRCCDGY